MGDSMEIKNIKDFLKHIKSRDINGGILIFGEEKDLIHQSIDAIYDLIISFREMNIIEIDGENVTFDEILNSCETIPFMSEKKLVHIKNPYFLLKGSSGASSSEITDALSKYIPSLSKDIILLLSSTGEVEVKNKVVAAFKNAGLLVEYKKYKGEDLNKWVVDQFEAYGKSISKADLMYLISEIGASTDMLAREIEKLCAFAIDEEVITKAHIDEISYKSLESNIFKMVDYMSKKDAEKSLSILRNLLFQKEDHLRILGMIIRQYRLLYLVLLSLKSNKSNSEIERSLKISGFVLQNFVKQSRGYNEKDLIKSLNLCLEKDFEIKSGKYPPDLGLEMLIVELCK